MNPGIFDVVGPIFHGPSSNHTGGVVRIGYLARQVMGGCPEKIRIGLHPLLMKNYTGQRTHAAMTAGLMGIREYELSCADSLSIAASRGITWEAYPVEETASRNTMRAAGTVNGLYWEVNGDSIGGGNVVIDSINGLPVFFDGNSWEVVALTEDDTLLPALKEGLSRYSVERWDEGETRGRRLACAVLLSEPPKGEELPAPLREAVEKGTLLYHCVAPLTPFSDKKTAEPLFTSFAELERLCDSEDITDVVIRNECSRDGVTAEEVMTEMGHMVDVMTDTLSRGQNGGIHLIGGLTDPEDGMKLLRRSETDEGLLGRSFSRAMGLALITSQMNASGERIVAAPTGGSSGILPAVLTILAERFGLNREKMVDACFTAAAIGIVMGRHIMFSGTTSGCQGEVGVSAGMAAGAAVRMAGGDAVTSFHAAAMAVKNLQGLTCDLPTSPIEVPCIKRNAIGTVIALGAADMALAGVRSAISPDDVTASLGETAKLLPACLRCDQRYGLGGTPGGEAMKARWQQRLSTLK